MNSRLTTKQLLRNGDGLLCMYLGNTRPETQSCRNVTCKMPILRYLFEVLPAFI